MSDSEWLGCAVLLAPGAASLGAGKWDLCKRVSQRARPQPPILGQTSGRAMLWPGAAAGLRDLLLALPR